jgi:putative transposase
MARKPRFGLSGVPQHVIQRGNNRAPCFFDDEDYRFYLDCLREASRRYQVAVHAYVLMPNHVHLLLTPEAADGVSRFMQHLGRRYVQYVNFAYRRSGTLWEGRYKAALVDAECCLLATYRFIECNPVRAGLAVSPADYPWSSYAFSALGVPDRAITPHSLYRGLGPDAHTRQVIYRDMARTTLHVNAVEEIRIALQQQVVYGSEQFKEQIEQTCSYRVRPGLRGRPRKLVQTASA